MLCIARAQLRKRVTLRFSHWASDDSHFAHRIPSSLSRRQNCKPTDHDERGRWHMVWNLNILRKLMGEHNFFERFCGARKRDIRRIS